MADYGNAPAGRDLFTITHNAGVTGLVEGAIAAIDPNAADSMVAVLPTGAAAKNLRGIVMDNFGSQGVPVGNPAALRRYGIAGVLIAAATPVTRGDKIIAANNLGHGKPRTNETDCTMVGEAMETIAAQANPRRIAVLLEFQYVPA